MMNILKLWIKSTLTKQYNWTEEKCLESKD